MNPLELWPWALLVGLAVFAFVMLGPIISGLLLIVLLVIIMGNLLSH